MMALYGGYIYVDHFKYDGNRFTNGDMIAAADVDVIQQRANWLSSIEGLLVALFIMTLIFCLYHKTIKQFVLANLVLFISISIIGYLLSMMTPAPIGNVLEPLFVPTILWIGVIVYVTFRKGRRLWNSTT
jgi:membrane-associated HD superfamily phosphohydrolase